jgi:hypothetical protein
MSENHLENTGIPWIYMDLPSIYGIFTWVCAMEWGLAILEQEPNMEGEIKQYVQRGLEQQRGWMRLFLLFHHFKHGNCADPDAPRDFSFHREDSTWGWIHPSCRRDFCITCPQVHPARPTQWRSSQSPDLRRWQQIGLHNIGNVRCPAQEN